MHGRNRSGCRQAARLLVLAAALWISAGPTSAETQWVDHAQFTPFRCRADFPLADFQSMLAELRALKVDLRQTLRLAGAAEPVELFLFRDRNSYRDYIEHYYPGVPLRRALFIKYRGPGMVFAYRSDAIATDLRHEATHALLHSELRSIPFWLDEGLAEYFELPRALRQARHPHLAVVRQNCLDRVVPRLARLEKIDDLKQMGGPEYRDSWAWVHFMLHGPPAARDELLGYLADLKHVRRPEPLSIRLHRRIPHLEERFIEHFTSEP